MKAVTTNTTNTSADKREQNIGDMTLTVDTTTSAWHPTVIHVKDNEYSITNVCSIKPITTFQASTLHLTTQFTEDVTELTGDRVCLERVQILDAYNTQTQKGKGKSNVNLYSVSSWTPLMHSYMDHTVLPANNTISAFTRKHSSGGATTHIRIANAWVQLTTHLSTPRGWMAELAMLADIQRTVYPEVVTRQLHVMAQARESSPVIDRRSNQCGTPQTNI